jgi:hypothetical protein
MEYLIRGVNLESLCSFIYFCRQINSYFQLCAEHADAGSQTR